MMKSRFFRSSLVLMPLLFGLPGCSAMDAAAPVGQSVLRQGTVTVNMRSMRQLFADRHVMGDGFQATDIDAVELYVDFLKQEGSAFTHTQLSPDNDAWDTGDLGHLSLPETVSWTVPVANSALFTIVARSGGHQGHVIGVLRGLGNVVDNQVTHIELTYNSDAAGRVLERLLLASQTPSVQQNPGYEVFFSQVIDSNFVSYLTGLVKPITGYDSPLLPTDEYTNQYGGINPLRFRSATLASAMLAGGIYTAVPSSVATQEVSSTINVILPNHSNPGGNGNDGDHSDNGNHGEGNNGNGNGGNTTLSTDNSGKGTPPVEPIVYHFTLLDPYTRPGVPGTQGTDKKILVVDKAPPGTWEYLLTADGHPELTKDGFITINDDDTLRVLDFSGKDNNGGNGEGNHGNGNGNGGGDGSNGGGNGNDGDHTNNGNHGEGNNGNGGNGNNGNHGEGNNGNGNNGHQNDGGSPAWAHVSGQGSDKSNNGNN